MGAHGGPLVDVDRLNRLLVERAREYAIFVTDLNGTIVSWNAGAERILGYAEDEIVGRHASIIFTPEDIAACAPEREIGEALSEGCAEDKRWHMRKDGSRFWANGVLEAVLENGRPIALAKILRDETTKKLEEEEQARAAARVQSDHVLLEAIVKQMRSGVFIAESPTGRIVSYNEQALRMLGHGLIEADGVDEYARYGAVHADGSAYRAHEYPTARALAGETVDQEDMLYRQGDDALVHLAVSAAPVHDGDDRIVAAVCTFHDVSEQSAQLERERLARESAEAASRRAELLSEVSTVLSSSLDYETTLAAVARLVVPQLADWCAVDIVGADGSLRMLVVEHEDPAKVAKIADLATRFPRGPAGQSFAYDVVKTGEPRVVAEVTDDILRALSRSAEHLEFLQSLRLGTLMCVPLRARGKAFGAITIASEAPGEPYDAADLAFAGDLAFRAGLAVDSARLYREAQEANRAKDVFLATVSHELRTPLNAVLGWARMMRDGMLDAAATERGLETIERSARTQATLIEDLLDISRVLSGKLRLNTIPLDLPSIVHSTVESILPSAEAKRITIQQPVECDARMVGDPDRLRQIFSNLLANAVKFTPEGGTVEVRLDCHERTARVSVRDTGQGIEPQFLPYVFELFRQADDSSARRQGGLGLGLAIVRQLAELHGGTVRVESPGLGLGSTFTVALPLAPTDDRVLEAGPDERRTLEELPRLDDVHVLVVDDDPDALAFAATLLELRGARVTTAASAAEALELLGRARPDVLVSDIGMPGGDGFALIRDVRALGPDEGGRTPAVALTAYAGGDARRRALLAGFQSYLSKPVEPGELIATIANLAAGR